MDATRWAWQFSSNVAPPATSSDGWSFTFPNVDGAHYLVHPVNGYLRGSLHVQFYLQELGGVTALWQWDRSNNGCPDGAHVSLYMQKRGDDFTATNPNGRFFQPLPFINIDNLGSYDVLVPVDPAHWINVNGQQDPAGFAATTSDLQAVGLVFGGGCFAGHGLWTDPGSVMFVMQSYRVE
jgi:hypothetical protein